MPTYGDRIKYNILVDLFIMLHLLMMQLEKIGFISLDINLISTRNLGDGRCLFTFGETWWNITKGSLVIAKGDRVGML